MGMQARHALRVSLLISSIAVLFFSGCCSDQGYNKCTPRSSWQSPTINTMRSLLLVNREELRIVLVDGCEMCPTHVSDTGVREYLLTPGEHTITAVFRYQVDPLADVAGQPLTLAHTYEAGHVYVASYQEHIGEAPELEIGVAEVTSMVIDSPELYWSLDVLDVDDPVNVEPEVEQAREYNAWIMGVSASL